MTQQVYRRLRARITVLMVLVVLLLLVPGANPTSSGWVTSALPADEERSVSVAADVASYRINARLSSDGTSISGTELVTYRNGSQDTLAEVYLHLYLNAFASPDTLWMREAGGQHRGFDYGAGTTGSISVESLNTDGEALALELDPDQTIARIPLSRPLAPGDEVVLDIAWTSKLPRVFARTGWAPGGFTMAGQWYPKLAVYDPRRGGWDREPWHANAEFFHDFGSYELTLVVPSERTVVATGEPIGAAITNGDGTTTWRFRADSVNDVAWMAAEGFAIQSRTIDDVIVAVALPVEYLSLADRYLEIAGYSLLKYAEWLGAYPWPRLTVVVPPDEAGGAGGMEYPTLVTAILPWTDLPGIRFPEMVTAHEVAHQWFPMQVASNEARDPWLDEATADYLTQRLMAELYGADRSLIDLPFARAGHMAELRAALPAALRLPINLPAWEYSMLEYGAAVYGKGALFFTTLERVFGADEFTKGLRRYVSEWRWSHPLPADLRASLKAEIEQSQPGAVDAWFDQLAERGQVLDVRVVSDATKATVERTGDAMLPVDGVLVLESGERQAWRLAAESRELDLAPPRGERIETISVDPSLPIVPNAVDDGYVVTAQIAEVVSLAGRLVSVFALLLQFAGQFG